jgi:hypothetical protein
MMSILPAPHRATCPALVIVLLLTGFSVSSEPTTNESKNEGSKAADNNPVTNKVPARWFF